MGCDIYQITVHRYGEKVVAKFDGVPLATVLFHKMAHPSKPWVLYGYYSSTERDGRKYVAGFARLKEAVKTAVAMYVARHPGTSPFLYANYVLGN